MQPRNPLFLYRSLLRAAKNFTDYNFRSYAYRRVRTEFRENVSLAPVEAEVKYNEGLVHLGVLTRQSIVSSLYPENPSVMI
mmetsp:Transcript_22614/g.33070  ORF Transcript_22614/g.33070 Transcript_22614/m.33070 type:complete len:81 (-) Transcript_22614:126-368(-)